MKCSKCSTELKEQTTAYSVGICIPCSEDRSLFNDVSKNIRNFSLHPDGQCVDMEKLKETSDYVDYSITATLWDIDPRLRSRNIIVGSTTGIFRLHKSTGNIDIVYPILHDKGIVEAKAKHRLLKLYKEGVFPEKTGHYSG